MTTLLAALLLPAAQCGGCQPAVLSIDDEARAGAHAEATATGALSFVTIAMDSTLAGICGPGIGTTCSEQVSPAWFEASISAWSDPSEIVVVQFAGGPVIVPPAGRFDAVSPVSVPCGFAYYSSANMAVFDASSLRVLDETALRYWGTGCPKPD